MDSAFIPRLDRLLMALVPGHAPTPSLPFLPLTCNAESPDPTHPPIAYSHGRTEMNYSSTISTPRAKFTRPFGGILVCGNSSSTLFILWAAGNRVAVEESRQFPEVNRVKGLDMVGTWHDSPASLPSILSLDRQPRHACKPKR